MAFDLDDEELKATRRLNKVEKEIQVGEYVRTKFGEILKIDGLRDMGYIEKGNPYFKQQIKKHSFNIIDLIEVGDYVNGKKIEAIIDGGWQSQNVAERVLCFEIDFPIEKGLRAYHNCDIKSIVTKEQFASIEYKVKE